MCCYHTVDASPVLTAAGQPQQSKRAVIVNLGVLEFASTSRSTVGGLTTAKSYVMLQRELEVQPVVVQTCCRGE